MRIREIVRFELAYRLQSRSTWAYALFLFLVTNWMFLAVGSESGAVQPNAPAQLAEAMAVVSIFGMVIAAALYSDVGTRDTSVQMDPLLFTTPLRGWEYVVGRFTATVLTNAMLVSVIPLGLVVNLALNPLGLPLGPWRVAAFVQPFVGIVLPNIVVVGALLFLIAMRTRQVLPVYLGAGAVFFTYLLLIEHRVLLHEAPFAFLADPLWLARLQLMVGTWTPAEQNTQLIGLTLPMLANRVLWCALGVVIVAWFGRRFRLEHAAGAGRDRAVEAPAVAPVVATVGATVNIPLHTSSWTSTTRWRQLRSLVSVAFTDIARGWPLALTMVGAVLLTLLWGWNVSTTVFDTSTWPVTMLVAETVMGARVTPLVWILLAVWSGELVAKDREVGVAEISDAAPVSDGWRFVARFGTLAILLLLLHAAFLVAGLVLQTAQGYTNYELGLYVRILFGLHLVDHLLFALLALVIHEVVAQKYVGHVVVFMVFLAVRLAPALLTRHNLLVYGGDPGWTYSMIAGFGPFLTPWAWFKVYWAAWAVLLGVLATIVSVRGPDAAWRWRLRAASARMSRSTARVATLAAVVAVGAGSFIFYNTNILNAYETAQDVAARLVRYEQHYQRFASLRQPRITAVDVRVEIDSPARQVTLQGDYLLVNPHDEAIGEIHVVVPDPAVTLDAIAVDRPGTVVRTDTDVGYTIVRLDRPMQPADTLRLTFTTRHTTRGFPNHDVPTQVRTDGASFDRRWLPFIGYQRIFELTDADQRSRAGLPPRDTISTPDRMANRFGFTDADLVHTRVTIGTSADQIAVTSGVLTRQWREGERSYFTYESTAPTAFGATIYSGRYDVRRDQWRNVQLEVYRSPVHRENLDRTFAGMKAALEYLSTNISPYPEPHLRVVEFPRFGGFGIAHPNVIGFAEDYFLSRVCDGEVDQPFYGTAHEVAHQWWGGRIRGATVPGYALLSESLANYTAMVVTERSSGAEAGRTIYRAQMDRYLQGRAQQGREVPLLDVTDQPYIAYRKGAIVLYNLRALIGEAAVTAALKRYHDRFADQQPPFATSRDLYAELKAASPDSLHPWLADMFERVTLWDLQIETAEAARNDDGTYTLTMRVIATKVQADQDGRETEVPMAETVLFEALDADGRPVFRGRLPLRSGSQTLRVTTSARPVIAAVDPERWLFDRQPHNDRIEVRETLGPIQP